MRLKRSSLRIYLFVVHCRCSRIESVDIFNLILDVHTLCHFVRRNSVILDSKFSNMLFYDKKFSNT